MVHLNFTCYHFPCINSPLTEALWQPAKKSNINENRRPIYVFSTDLANSAADAVLKNRYDTIIQFHNAQPKGPGFLRLLKDSSKRETNSVQKDSDDEDERGGTARAPKRRSSRLSTSDETPTTKKLRSGGQMKSSDDSKNPRTRFSRRIRKQQHTSRSPPSSPTSDHSDSGSQPSPVTHRGRGGQRSSRGGGRRVGRGRGRGGRESPLVNSGRRQRRVVEGEQEDDSEEEDDEQDDEREEDGQMDDSRDTDKVETAEDGEDKDNISKRQPDTYHGRQDMSPPESAPTLDTQPSSQQPVGKEENNYTICHGTPRTKGSHAVDMSSPAAKAPHLPKSTAVSSPSGASCTTPPSVSHPTQHDIASLGLAEKRQQMSSTTPAVIVGSRPQDPMLGHHPAQDLHKDAAAPNNWPGGLGPQFSHIPGGYYSAGIHPMHYPPHATQHVPGNYPYGVYPWAPHPVGQHAREQHPYVTHESVAQHANRSTASSQAGHLSQTATSHVAYQHPTHNPHSASTETGKEMNSAGSQGRESGSAVMKPPASHEKHSLPSPQTHLAHSHSTLHQLAGSGSTQAAALSQVHHAFPRPPHALTTEQISAVHHPAAAFPYGFDPSNPATLSHMHHLWQQQQHQIRAAGVHPSHLSPHLQHHAAGMWYAPHMQQLMHGGIADESAKRRAAQSAGSKHPSVDASALRMNSNRNNNTTSTLLHLQQVRTHTGQQSQSHNTMLHGETEFTATSQAMDWTRPNTADVQLTSGSFP